MFLKLLKGIIFLLAAGVITYCVIHNQNFSVKPQSEKHVKNSAKKIKYKKRLNGGMLTLMAKSADVSVEGSILLTDVIATFEKNKKTITIRCENCNLKPKKQRAYLKKNVCIKTGNAICYTDAATVNFVENSIFGKSKMHGIQSGTKFVSNGFLMKEDGNIKLNKAKIVKNKRQ
jgi:hypothetical protein